MSGCAGPDHSCSCSVAAGPLPFLVPGRCASREKGLQTKPLWRQTLSGASGVEPSAAVSLFWNGTVRPKYRVFKVSCSSRWQQTLGSFFDKCLSTYSVSAMGHSEMSRGNSCLLRVSCVPGRLAVSRQFSKCVRNVGAGRAEARSRGTWAPGAASGA